MKINILLIYQDSLNLETLPCPEYYHYLKVSKSTFEGNSFKLFSYLWRTHNVKVFYTIGGSMAEWLPLFGFFPYQVRKKWIHYEKVEHFNPSSIPRCLVAGSRNSEQSLISVLTTTFHSGDKLNRPLESLNAQSYNNWEWVIWDDSKDELTWKQLQKLALTDMRIRIYKAPHNGFIGEVKRRSGALCQGDWIVELDHDDHISDDLFNTILEIGKKYPKAGFIYSDFFMLGEEGETPQTFGAMAAFGYAGYFKEWCRGKFHNVYYAQSLNPVTITHIVGVPNHVRIWKREVYEALDKHNEDLPVVDDYELLLRTFLYDCEWVRIPRPCYAQYNNSGGNNFTYIRNKLIQHLSEYTWKVYSKEANQKFVELDYPVMSYPNEPIWLNANPEPHYYENIYYQEEVSVLLTVPLKANSEHLEKCLQGIYAQKVSFILFIVGHPHSELERMIEKWRKAHPETLKNLRYWNFRDALGRIYGPEHIWKKKTYHHHLKNYGLKIGVRTKWVVYLEPKTIWEEQHLEQLLEAVQEKDYYYRGEDFIHSTDLCQKRGYWKAADTPNSLIEKWA